MFWVFQIGPTENWSGNFFKLLPMLTDMKCVNTVSIAKIFGPTYLWDGNKVKNFKFHLFPETIRKRPLPTKYGNWKKNILESVTANAAV